MNDTSGATLLLLGGWILWCFFHSLLVRPWVRRIILEHLPIPTRFYRLMYVLFSVLTLLPLAWYQHRIPSVALFSWDWPWSILSWTGVGLAGLCLFLAGRSYHHAAFFGVDAFFRSSEIQEDEATLVTHGIHRYIRHPYYTATFLFLLFLGSPTLVDVPVRLVLMIYLVIGTHFEERDLVRRFGESYRRYQRETPMYFPRWWSARKAG